MYKRETQSPVLEEDRGEQYRKGRNGTGLRAYSREWVHPAVVVVVVLMSWESDVSRLCLIDSILQDGHSSFPCLESSIELGHQHALGSTPGSW